MAQNVHVALKAEGQGLEVQAPPVLASAAVNHIVFDVTLSDEWAGFSEYYVMVRNSVVVRGCAINDGVAVASGDAIAKAGAIEVSIMARGDGKRLTTESVAITLKSSGL